MINPGPGGNVTGVTNLGGEAKALGMMLEYYPVRDNGELEQAFEAVIQ